MNDEQQLIIADKDILALKKIAEICGENPQRFLNRLLHDGIWEACCNAYKCHQCSGAGRTSTMACTWGNQYQQCSACAGTGHTADYKNPETTRKLIYGETQNG